MINRGDEIRFDNKGIATVISQNLLKVPLNQREYSWEENHISELFTDLSNAVEKQQSYFLGTIVLTTGEDGSTEVSDGQQRLATTSILIAAIRDYFYHNNERVRSQSIENQFLKTVDYKTTENYSRFRLNVDDNEFFANYIIASPNEAQRKNAKPSKESHNRIKNASKLAKRHIDNIVSQYSKHEHKVTRLVEWVDFLSFSANVILLKVPDHLNAFMMFETLNDRGLKASQVDLLKNHLLSLTGNRIKEGQQKWSQMLGTLESVKEDLALTYIHHYLIMKHGQTKLRDVFNKVKQSVNSQGQAIAFLDDLAECSNDYISLFNPENKKWNEYNSITRKHISTLNRDLDTEQSRPLIFAVIRYFSKTETTKALRLFVFWTVRIMIGGIRGGGKYDVAYSSAANKIASKKITNVKELFKALEDVIPNDIQFEQSFSNFTTSKAHFARYLLRSLEIKKKNEPDPEFNPNENELVINLEHILPENPSTDWKINPDEAAFGYRKLGNMVIMQAKKNSIIGNSKFSEKKKFFNDSAYLLTQEVSKYKKWDIEEINKRQKELAKLALETWALS